MFTPFKAIASGLLLAVGVGAGVAAQQPRIQNGAVTTQPAGTPFIQSFRSLVSATADVAWNSALGISLPTLRGASIRQAGTRSRSN